MRVIKRLITYTLYPGLIALCMLGGAWFLQHDYSLQWILAGFTVFSVLVIIVSEKVNPYLEEWNLSHKDEATDAMHNIVSMIILPQLIELLTQLIFLSVAIKLTAWMGSPIWPTSWPILLQVFIGLFISDFGSYWIHRLCHESPLLWRLHATHHSSSRLYWLNAGRFHPLDTLLENSLSTGILIVLGVTPQVLTLRALFTAVNGMFKHCNINVKIGPLNWIVGASEVHRWHHSKNLREANANYGTNLILWDIIFKTYYFPKNRTMDKNVGLVDMPAFPKNYLGQILSPFNWKRILNNEEKK